MNNIKVKVYKKVIEEISQMYEGAEDFTKTELIRFFLKKSC